MSDTRKIAAAFHSRAAEYDQHVAVQKRVVNNLADYVELYLKKIPDTILDVGTGTGSMLHSLRAVYPEASLYGVDLAYNMCLRAASKLGVNCLAMVADAENLPIAGRTIDLVVSTSALQWAGSISRSLQEMRRVVKPGGILCIAFFCEGTFYELQRSIRDAVGEQGDEGEVVTDRLHHFRTLEEVKSILEKMDFEQVVLRSETEMEWYDDLTTLLRSIKKIGAGAVAGGSTIGLGWRGVINRTSRVYRETFGRDGKIPATYEVLYIYAKTRESKEQQLFSGPAD